jgi:ubiquinone/menaquinone biosynthesis C-methylase UbiE
MSVLEKQIEAERERLKVETRRRDLEVDAARYAHWQPAEILMRSERKQIAATMLHQAGVFPVTGDSCLEIGFGALGWLGDLITWGVRETDLHGIDLDATRAMRAREILPCADLRVGDAGDMPWDTNTFRLVVASTVFTSILDQQVRRMVAAEITRVLAPGGALLWYDFAFNNPFNPNVRKVSRREVPNLFPRLHGRIRSLTLAPPLARMIAPKSWTMARILNSIPILRTHLLGVLIKD